MARQPFYGRGPGPQIARMDMNAATAPGRAYGQMFANLGKIAGDSIEKYAEGKKKKEEQKQTASFIKRALINSPEIAAQFGIQGDDSMTFEEAVDQGSNAIAKDPKGFEMVKGFAAMAAQQRKAQQDTELFNRKISQFDQSQETAKELKEKTAGFEEYLSEQPQVIDPTGPGRFDVLRNLREGKGVTPPARMIPGASPAEEMLMSPEAKSFARRAVEGGQPMSLVMPMAQKIDSQIAAQTPKPYSPTELKALRELEKPSLTVGEETIDREFAKDIVSLNPADINKGLTQLREASARLGGTAKDEDGKAIEPEDLTGAMIGLMPDAFNDIINPQASEVKEAVEEVVQRNLRLILGAAFSQKEGERLINRAYNIRLSEEENKKRVDRLIKSIESAMKEKQAQARYFNENSTLKGYQFAPISIQSIERDAFGENSNDPSAPASQATLDALEKKRQLRSNRAGL